MGKYMIVQTGNSSGLNMRVKPQTSAKLHAASPLANGTMVAVLAEFDDWVKVMVGPNIGYCMTKFLVDAPEDDDDDPGEPAQRVTEISAELEGGHVRVVLPDDSGFVLELADACDLRDALIRALGVG